MNTTETFWDVDGESLQTMCRNVETLAPKWKLPTHRGDDKTVTYRHGSVWRKKYLDSKTESLGMWVDGTDENGAISAIGQERQFNKNMSDLRDLLFREFSEQVSLTKRWRDPDTGEVMAATAKAELDSDFAVAMMGPYAAKLVVDFRLAEPFYVGEMQSLTVSPGTPEVADVAGDISTDMIMLTFNGALANPEIINSTPSPNSRLRVGGAIASGDSVVVDVRKMMATRTSDSANLIGAVNRSGQPQFMILRKGENLLTLEATSGTGSVTVDYHPLYL